MRTRRPTPGPEAVDDSFSEIEADIKPPLQRRLKQFLIAALVIITLVSLIAAKVMGDQRQQAVAAKDQAVAAASTAVAQVTAMSPGSSQAVDGADSQPDGTSIQPSRPLTSTDTRRQFGRNNAAAARSRELSYAALGQLDVDPERAILIALEANASAHTAESEDALRRAVQASHLRLQLICGDGGITSASFSPQGNLLLMICKSGTVRVWNAHTGAELRQLPQPGITLSAQFSPDGRTILTTSTDKTARLWSASDGSPLEVLVGHQSDVTVARFSPDGKRILTGSLDQTARIWDTADISNSLVLTGSPSVIDNVEWSPDGARVLASGRSGLSMWDAQTGQQLFKVENSPLAQTILDAHLSPDGKQLVMTGSAPVRILDAVTGQTLYTLAGTYADYAQYSSDGKRLLTGLWLWDLQNQQFMYAFPKPFGFAARLSPDGKYIASQSDPTTLTIWDAATASGQPQTAATLKSNSDYLSISFSADSQALVSVERDGSARVWDIAKQDKPPGDYGGLLALARTRVTRALTCAERQTYLRDTTSCSTSGQ
jgi:WD40 repeat protein